MPTSQLAGAQFASQDWPKPNCGFFPSPIARAFERAVAAAASSVPPTTGQSGVWHTAIFVTCSVEGVTFWPVARGGATTHWAEPCGRSHVFPSPVLLSGLAGWVAKEKYRLTCQRASLISRLCPEPTTAEKLTSHLPSIYQHSGGEG